MSGERAPVGIVPQVGHISQAGYPFSAYGVAPQAVRIGSAAWPLMRYSPVSRLHSRASSGSESTSTCSTERTGRLLHVQIGNSPKSAGLSGKRCKWFDTPSVGLGGKDH